MTTILVAYVVLAGQRQYRFVEVVGSYRYLKIPRVDMSNPVFSILVTKTFLSPLLTVYQHHTCIRRQNVTRKTCFLAENQCVMISLKFALIMGDTRGYWKLACGNYFFDLVFRSEHGEQNRYYFNHIEMILSNSRNRHLVFEKW